jgi:hypothetical protein
VGRAATRAFRRWQVDQAPGARDGLSKNTIRRALRSEAPPSYQQAPKVRVVEPFKDEIRRLLAEDPKLPGVRVRELLEPLGCTVGKTAVDDYLREVRPLFSAPARTFARAVWRPGEVCQFDVWQPKELVPVGHGQTRPGWVVVACLGFSRAGAGVRHVQDRADQRPRLAHPRPAGAREVISVRREGPAP